MRPRMPLMADAANPPATPRRCAMRWTRLVWLLPALLLLPAATQAESYRYDAAGRLIEVGYPDGTLIRYGYDANSNLVSGQVVGDAIFDNGFES